MSGIASRNPGDDNIRGDWSSDGILLENPVITVRGGSSESLRLIDIGDF